MPSPSPATWKRCAIRLVSVGIGAAVAGPLGAALGGMLGPIVSDQSEALLNSYGEATGNTFANIGANFCYDQLRQIPTAPDLETVVRLSLRDALHDIHNASHADWFTNWRTRLNHNGPVTLDALSTIRDHLAPSAANPDPAALQQRLDDLFRSTMERLDGEAHAANSSSVSITNHFRSMPPELLTLLLEKLPASLTVHFESVVTLPEHDRAFKRVLLRTVNASLAEATETRRLIERTFETELVRAREENALAQQQVQKERESKEQYLQKYLKLLEDITAREKQEPAPPLSAAESFGDLLEKGDLEAAARLKQQAIGANTSTLARDYFDLGRVHELRFAWPQALDAHAEAWRLQKSFDFGSQYAYVAQKQNRFSQATRTY